MGKQTITIYDVAREAQVSMATVSRVVNGNPNVKKATRDKVLKVIKELGYRPNAVARGLASNRTRSIGVLIPDITNAYYGALAQGISDIASIFKYNIILSSLDTSDALNDDAITSILSRQVDGIVYVGRSLNEHVRKEVERTNTPVVITGAFDGQEEFPTVNIDSQRAVYEVTKKFLDEGLKKIAFVGEPESFIDGFSDRFAGYKAAFKEANEEVSSTLFFRAKDLSLQEGRRIGGEICDADIEAVVVLDDELSVGILNEALDRGKKVPEELQIISSNNTKLVQMTRPQLSSIEPPVYDIGAVAMRVLTKLMDQEELDEKHYTLPYRVIYRGTTK